ncbi:MAG: insulinase family protein [Endomicrobium sp.]|jgi:hypothetical protein|nr:insulinase family protein [Endomicrobium sp.]
MLRKKNYRICLLICFAIPLFRFITHAQELNVIKQKEKVSPKSRDEKIRKASWKLKDNVLDKVPVAGKIVNEEKDDKTDTIIWTLSNGAKFILKNVPKKHENDDDCRLYALAKGGILNLPKKDIVSALYVNTVFYERWYDKKFPNHDIPNLSINLFTHSLGAFIDTNKTSVKSLFESFYWTFTNLKIDYKSLKAYAAKEKAILKYRDSAGKTNNSLINRLNDDLNIIYNDPYYLCHLHPHNYISYSVPNFDKFNINTIDKLLKKYLNPADYTFVLAISIDDNVRNHIKEYVETYLASIPASKEMSTLPESKITFISGVKNISHIEDAHKYLYERMYFVVHDQHMPKNRIVADILQRYLCRTTRVLKEYNDCCNSCSKNTEVGNRNAVFSISFRCTANNVDKKVTATIDDIKAIAAGKIDLNIFNKIKENMKKDYEKDLQCKWWLADTYANFVVIYDKPLIDIYENKKIYDDVTPKDLQEVTTKILTEGISYILEYPKSLKK